MRIRCRQNMSSQANRAIEKLNVGAFVGNQIEPVRVPRSDQSNHINPATALLSDQSSQIEPASAPWSDQGSQILPTRAPSPGQPDRANRGRIEPTRASHVDRLVAQVARERKNRKLRSAISLIIDIQTINKKSITKNQCELGVGK